MAKQSSPGRILGIAVLALAAAGKGRAQAPATTFHQPVLTVIQESGRLESALFENTLPIKDAWVHRSGAWITFRVDREKRMAIEMQVGGTYYTSTKEQTDVNTKYRFFAPSVRRLDVSYLVGDLGEPFLRINAGIFHYKYNEYSRNLGEYMFRTGTYPGWIATGLMTLVGVNDAQLTGFKIGQNLGPFSHDLIFNLETDILPTYDLNATYMAKLNLGGVLKLGAGVQFARLLPAKPSVTNPSFIRDPTKGEANPVESNRYFEHNGVYYVDWKRYYEEQIGGILERNTNLEDTIPLAHAIKVLDSIRTPGPDGTPLLKPAFEHFNGSGIKPVGHFAFDPKPLFATDIFGPNDLVLYGEAAILGVKDYPVLYGDITQRMPMMIGFNVPTFKLLDVLAVEFEQYKSPFPNSYAEVMTSGGVPRPTLSFNGRYLPEYWADDDTKWSVFASRRIIDGVSGSVQVARDHARGWQYPAGKTWWSIISKKSHWYWMFKLTASI